MPPVFEMIPVQLLGVRGLATRQVRLLLYSSERSNTRATHIQCCPREPRESFADHQKFPANRVRSATPSGSVVQSDAAARRGCQFGKRTVTSFFSKTLSSRLHSGFTAHHAGVVRRRRRSDFCPPAPWRRRIAMTPGSILDAAWRPVRSVDLAPGVVELHSKNLNQELDGNASQVALRPTSIDFLDDQTGKGGTCRAARICSRVQRVDGLGQDGVSRSFLQ